MTRRATIVLLGVVLLMAVAAPALAWDFSVDGECKVLTEEGVYIVTFTIDNTSEPQALNIIDQDPDSGITSVPAGATASWSLTVPLDTDKEGASWEVLGNWPGDQRPRHRVASVRFGQECPYVPPTTTTTSPTTTTTTSTSSTTTTTTPGTTTTAPTSTTSSSTSTTVVDPTTTSSSSTTTTSSPPTNGSTVPPTTLIPPISAQKRCDPGAGLIVIETYEDDLLTSRVYTSEKCGEPVLPHTGASDIIVPGAIAGVALLVLSGVAWSFDRMKERQ